MTVRLSNEAFLTVLPPRSLEGVGWAVRVLSERDYSSPIALVERFAGLGFTVEANAEGGGTVTLDADDAVFSAPLPAGETVRLADQEALWQVLEDGQVRFEFLAEDVDADVIAEDGGPRETVITGRGTASVLEWAPVLPAGMPTPSSMSRKFELHPMAAWHALFVEAQAAGFLTWVNLSFDAAEDSTGAAWGPAQSLTVNAGDTLLDLLKRWAEANELRWRMLPGFTLEVRQGDGSHLEDSVVFTQFRSQGGHRRKVTRRELANVVYADSGDNGLAIAEDGTSAAKWRKRAAWITAGDASDASARSMVANVSLGLAKDQRISRTIALIPDREGRHPFVDFNVHDWVGVEVPDDDTESGARKVAGLAVDIDADGAVQYEATLSSRFEVRAVKTQRLLDKLGGSERSGSGGAAASPIPVSKVVSAVNLADLSDVDLTAPAAGSLLEFSGGRWVDVVANLDLLADVETSGASAPTDGQALVYDSASGLWQPGTIAGGGGGGGSGLAAVVAEFPPFDLAATVSTSAYRHKGTRFDCQANCTVTRFSSKFTAVSGRSYKFGVWSYDRATKKLVALIGEATVVASTSAALAVHTTGPVSWNLDAGTSYAVLVSDTTGAAVSVAFLAGAMSWPAAFGTVPATAAILRTNTAALAPALTMEVVAADTYAVGLDLVAR